MADAFDSAKQAIAREEAVVLATVVSGAGSGAKVAVLATDSVGSTGDVILDVGVRKEAGLRLLSRETSLAVIPASGGQAEVFFEVFPPPDKLIIVGGVHVAISLVRLAKELGFHTTIVDARAVYATRDRFPEVDDLLVEWPADALRKMNLHGSTYCVFLTHDSKLDNPALEVALQSEARYIGALGSKRTHAKRVDALKDSGLTDEQIERIHAPIGLDLGGRRPEEIALSILAQMVAVRHGR